MEKTAKRWWIVWIKCTAIQSNASRICLEYAMTANTKYIVPRVLGRSSMKITRCSKSNLCTIQLITSAIRCAVTDNECQMNHWDTEIPNTDSDEPKKMLTGAWDGIAWIPETNQQWAVALVKMWWCALTSAPPVTQVSKQWVPRIFPSLEACWEQAPLPNSNWNCRGCVVQWFGYEIMSVSSM